jgi:phage portal protein BeeE
MALITEARARLWPRRPAPELAKASATGALVAWEPLGAPVWTPRDYQAFAREGFMQNAIVYRSVRMIAEAAATIPLLLYERDAEVSEHPLLELLRRPSADHTQTDFLEACTGSCSSPATPTRRRWRSAGGCASCTSCGPTA